MTRSLIRFLGCLAVSMPGGAPLSGRELAVEPLHNELEHLATTIDGRVGIGVRCGASIVAINGEQRFALQSVMKLIVGAAVLDAVDSRGWKLDESITIHREDLSLFVQPLAGLVTSDAGFTTTIDDLVSRAVSHSDSAATDVLLARLGGPPAIRAFLQRHQLSDGVRLDRDERHLQTELFGLVWHPEYVEADALQRAIDAVPTGERDAAFERGLRDERDTATPVGMVAFLHALTSGTLLPPRATERLLTIMRDTSTFPDRLKAGTPTGWSMGHKTGTSNTWRGVTAVTNDVGFMIAPDGGIVNLAVFIAESRASSEERAALMAQVAARVAHHYR